MLDTINIQVCQACGAPSTAGFSHELPDGGVHELCGRCGEVSDAISGLGGLTSYAARRERVTRILELLDQADEACSGESD
jgi:hypothetical protein